MRIKIEDHNEQDTRDVVYDVLELQALGQQRIYTVQSNGVIVLDAKEIENKKA